MFKAGSWAPVRSSGFAPGSVGVACKQMGFSGASSEATSSCAIDGPSAYGVTPPYVSKLSCTGHEATVLECASKRATMFMRSRRIGHDQMQRRRGHARSPSRSNFSREATAIAPAS